MDTPKQRFPANPPMLTLGGIPATLTRDFDKYSNGKMMMTYAKATAKDENGKEVGHVAFSVGGEAIEVCIGRRAYSISSTDLFNAVMAAEESK